MEKGIRYVLIVLAGVLALLLIFVGFQYQALRQQQIINMHQLHGALFLEHHAPLAVSEASTIRPWMTFDYINKLFALPPTYLKTQLPGVVSSTYPHLTISSDAKTENVDQTTFLNQVEAAVSAYTTSTSQTSTKA